MGRSVSYVGDKVIFFDCSDHEQEDWDDGISDIKYSVMKKYPKFAEVDKWHGRENHIFLESGFVHIACSEYCGFGSISVFVRDDTEYPYLAVAWLDANWDKIRGIISQYVSAMVKLGTFSNGEAVYKRENDGLKITDYYREGI